MSKNRRYRALAVLALALAVAGCGGQAAPATDANPATSPATMNLPQACQLLRSDMVSNGGTADMPDS